MLDSTTTRKAFVGRYKELNLLENLWHRDDSSLLVLYGRRRVGKTRLLTHWQNKNSQDAIYWVAEQTNSRSQLNSLSQELFRFEYPNRRRSTGYAFTDWEEIFMHMADLAADRKIAILLDEFTYLIDADPSIVGTLQKVWDHELKHTNIMLALSGSHLGVMQEKLVAYDAPLYGRATEIKNLEPLDFATTSDYFEAWSAEDRVALYSMVGGIPAYWERFSHDLPLPENIAHVMFEFNFMLEEPATLLRDHIDKPNNYTAILEAIARDNRTNSQITKATGLARTHVSTYLKILRNTGFVEKYMPVTEPSNNRKTKYQLTDPFLRFYYAYLASNRSTIAKGAYGQVLEKVLKQLPSFIGQNSWPDLCREWLELKSGSGEIEILFDEIGPAWSGQNQVDVCGLNHDEEIAYLGLTLWRDEPADKTDLQYLVRTASMILPKDKNWQVVLLCFSKSGFHDSADQFKQRVLEGNISGSQWQGIDLHLVGLDEVDQDLYRLSQQGN